LIRTKERKNVEKIDIEINLRYNLIVEIKLRRLKSMSCKNNNTNERKNKQFSATERGQIEAYLNEEKSVQYISDKLKRTKSSIYDEINRNSTFRNIRKDMTCKTCKHYETCTENNLCGKDYGLEKCSRCRGCSIAIKESCKKCEPINLFKCEKHKKKVCCNGCSKTMVQNKQEDIYCRKGTKESRKKKREFKTTIKNRTRQRTANGNKCKAKKENITRCGNKHNGF